MSNVDSTVTNIQSELITKVSSFCSSLKEKHNAEPDEYDLEDGAAVTDMFIDFIIRGDF